MLSVVLLNVVMSTLIRLSCYAMEKYSNLFCRSVSDKEKKLNNIGTW